MTMSYELLSRTSALEFKSRIIKTVYFHVGGLRNAAMRSRAKYSIPLLAKPMSEREQYTGPPRDVTLHGGGSPRV